MTNEHSKSRVDSSIGITAAFFFGFVACLSGLVLAQVYPAIAELHGFQASCVLAGTVFFVVAARGAWDLLD